MIDEEAEHFKSQMEEAYMEDARNPNKKNENSVGKGDKPSGFISFSKKALDDSESK